MRPIIVATAAFILLAAGSPGSIAAEPLTAPGSLAAEHEEIRQSLRHFATQPKQSAAAAQGLRDLMGPHMQKEEQFVYPPLSLLPAIAEGQVTPEMTWAISMADQVKAEQAALFDEHALIMDAVGDLVAAGEGDNEHDLVAFAQRVAGHAMIEAEVLEPAAILVGETLRQRLEAKLTIR
jgi:hypothetical protein